MGGEIKISVRTLVEFVLRSGDIDSHYMSSSRALEGTRVHQKLQKLGKSRAELNGWEYQKEVHLDIVIDYNDFIIRVDGRADSIFNAGGYITIEEIKSTAVPINEVRTDPTHWHWAQAKCYGCMYCEKHNVESVNIGLTYCNIESSEVTEFEEEFTREYLKCFFYDLIDKYLIFAKMDYERTAIRNQTAEVLAFPYGNYRKGQRELAVSIYAAISQSKKIFVQAPTGTGKTISALYPSIKALSKGLGSKIFYLTAKTITRQVAEDALEIMRQKGLKIKSVTITAKDKICFMAVNGERPGCNPITCPYAKGHFDRINAAIHSIVTNEWHIGRPQVEEYAGKHMVCPYELSLDASLFCDCVICDYNYVYDPAAKLKRYFADDIKNDFIILNDEAHNLHDRAREMFSASLGRNEFSEAKKLLRENKGDLYKRTGKISSYFRKLAKDIADTKQAVSRTAPSELYELANEFIAAGDEWLAENENADFFGEILELYFNVLSFIRIYEYFDERYVTFNTVDRKSCTTRLMCLDPSYLLSLTHKRVKSSIFYSATLTPLDYFKSILGGENEDYTLRLASPFNTDNMCLLIDNTISTKYKDRADSYEDVADGIYAMASCKKGNYFAFFSSYEYMRAVYEIFERKFTGISIRTIMQQQAMTEEEREYFLGNFTDSNKETLVGFVVLGGIFSEGIDLKGEKLIGAAVVGVGLPLITVERNVLCDYYNELNGTGYEYSYIFPGMNKVLQAAGRVIRTETDKGVILLMDSRFLNSDYKKIFPIEWGNYKTVSKKTIHAAIESFWNKSELHKADL